MKRTKMLLAVIAGCAGMATAPALDLGGISGTWQDTKWNADWTFSADGKIVLSDSATGTEYFTFAEESIQNFKADASASGVSISFDCKETGRSYKFTKPIALNADLKMLIQPEWTNEEYETTIQFKK